MENSEDSSKWIMPPGLLGDAHLFENVFNNIFNNKMGTLVQREIKRDIKLEMG